jgi:hypothetical protein
MWKTFAALHSDPPGDRTSIPPQQDSSVEKKSQNQPGGPQPNLCRFTLTANGLQLLTSVAEELRRDVDRQQNRPVETEIETPGRLAVWGPSRPDEKASRLNIWPLQRGKLSRSATLLLQLILRPGVDVFWNDSRGLFGSNDCCGNSGDKT